MVECILWPMVNEAARTIEDRTALRAADIDLVEIHGYGFPRWRGGPMYYAEARGLDGVVAALSAMAEEGFAEPPCGRLFQAAARGRFS